ncbi:MAG TPA: 30S ribosomal protein S8 [bacterium]|nr:30S ribosomal protein S8 [bacterium]
MNDLISNYLTRLRNAIRAEHETVVGIPSSRIVEGISQVLKEEGYISDFRLTDVGAKKTIAVDIRYHRGKPVISHIERVSKPGRRVYMPAKDIPHVRSGLGICVVSTSKGVLTDKKARELNVGGELLCNLW